MRDVNKMTMEDWMAVRSDITEAFSPGAPIQEKDLFAGRLEQLQTLLDAISQRGRHAIIFGERGVGKTSLSNILSILFQAMRKSAALPIRVNADPSDTFTSLWLKVFKRMSYVTEIGTKKMSEEIKGDLTPDDVQLLLAEMADHQSCLIVLDEFDRLADKNVSVLVADTIKALSDYSVNATIIIVGVAEDVQALITGHESIARSLVQVKMPRMSQTELSEIITSRYKRTGIGIDEQSLWKITFLSRGLPYYAQLIGMHAALVAIESKRARVRDDDVQRAISKALAELDRTITENYHRAVRSQRDDDSIYEPVLLACALATTDELGGFQQSAVGGPLNKILPGRNLKATTYAFHMNNFCDESRGRALTRHGEARNFRYRFTDPMMQPFVVLRGLVDGRINDHIAAVFESKPQLDLGLPIEDTKPTQ